MGLGNFLANAGIGVQVFDQQARSRAADEHLRNQDASLAEQTAYLREQRPLELERMRARNQTEELELAERRRLAQLEADRRAYMAGEAPPQTPGLQAQGGTLPQAPGALPPQARYGLDEASNLPVRLNEPAPVTPASAPSAEGGFKGSDLYKRERDFWHARDPAKAAEFDTKYLNAKKTELEQNYGKALRRFQAGDVTAIDKVFNDDFNDGFQSKTSRGADGKLNVEITKPDGTTEIKTYTEQEYLQRTQLMLKPENMLAMVEAEQKKGWEERKIQADEKRADAAVTTANAQATASDALAGYRNALTGGTLPARGGSATGPRAASDKDVRKDDLTLLKAVDDVIANSPDLLDPVTGKPNAKAPQIAAAAKSLVSVNRRLLPDDAVRIASSGRFDFKKGVDERGREYQQRVIIAKDPYTGQETAFALDANQELLPAPTEAFDKLKKHIFTDQNGKRQIKPAALAQFESLWPGQAQSFLKTYESSGYTDEAARGGASTAPTTLAKPAAPTPASPSVAQPPAATPVQQTRSRLTASPYDLPEVEGPGLTQRAVDTAAGAVQSAMSATDRSAVSYLKSKLQSGKATAVELARAKAIERRYPGTFSTLTAR